MKADILRILLIGSWIFGTALGLGACTAESTDQTTTIDAAAADDAKHPLAPTVAWLDSIGAKNGPKSYTVSDLKKIISLRLAVNKRVDDAALEQHVSKLTTLQSLSLDATSVTDAGLAHLATLTELRQLDLGSLKGVTGAGMAHLKTLSNLESLTLQQSAIVDEDLAKVVAELPQLKKLSLGWLAVDDGLKHLSGLEGLRDLDLFHAKVTDKGAAHLAKLGNLKKLLLWNTDISDKGLASVKGLDKLETLYISGTKVTDKGMKHLAGLEKLTYLWIPELPITDDGLAMLEKCKALRTIHAPKTKITKKGVEKLKKSIPEIKVTLN